MEILKIVETILLSIAIVCLALLFLQIRKVFIGDSDVQSLFLPIVMLLLASMAYFAVKKRVQEEQESFSKLHYESKLDYFYNDKGEKYYKLKLDNGDIIRDSLQKNEITKKD